MIKYPKVPLARVLCTTCDETVVEPDRIYQTAGLYSFGRGLFARPPTAGTDTKYRTLNRLHEGQFVVARLNGWEGALAVVEQQFDGMFMSQEFPTFNIDPEMTMPAYMALLCRWPAFWNGLGGSTHGSMVRRKRIHPDDILKVQIPLPDLEEQRRLSVRLARVFERASAARLEVTRAAALQAALTDQASNIVLSEEFGRSARVPLSEAVIVNPSTSVPTGIGPEDEVTFVPMRAVDEWTGTIAAPETKLLGDVKSGYKAFADGDVIFARITPCMENGKSAVARGLRYGVGFGSTEFHILRPRAGVDPEWIQAIVRSRSFRDEAVARFTGTAGQQRVPSEFLEHVEIPLPRPAAQAAALARLRSLATRFAILRSLVEGRQAAFKSLGPSILNQAFAG